MKNEENNLQRYERRLQPLTMKDADFRGLIASDCEPPITPEQLEFMNQQPVEQLRHNYLETVMFDL